MLCASAVLPDALLPRSRHVNAVSEKRGSGGSTSRSKRLAVSVIDHEGRRALPPLSTATAEAMVAVVVPLAVLAVVAATRRRQRQR